MARINDVRSGEDLDSGYDYVQTDYDIDDIIESNLVGLGEANGWSDGDLNDITGIIVKVGNAEYDEIWVTTSSRPYEINTTYELIFTQDALHDWIRNQ